MNSRSRHQFVTSSKHSQINSQSDIPTGRSSGLGTNGRSHSGDNELPENVLVDEDQPLMRDDDFGIAGSEEVVTTDCAPILQNEKIYHFPVRTRKVEHVTTRSSSSKKTLHTIPANVLLTDENLKGDPKVYVSVGRPPVRHSGERKKAYEYEASDPAPNLSCAVSDGLNDKVPGMQNFFRVVSESALQKAQQFRLLPDENDLETGGVGQIAIAGQIEECTEEILDEIIDSAEIIEMSDNEEEQQNDEESGENDTCHVFHPADMDNLENDAIEISESATDFNEIMQRHRLVPLTDRGAEELILNRVQVQHSFEGWPLYWDRPIDFQEACMILTGVRPAPSNKTCSSVPQNFRDEGTFIINLEAFQNRHDVALDGHGSWGKPNGRTRFYGMDHDGRPVRCDDTKGKCLPNCEYVWKCMSKRYEHPATVSVNNGRNRFTRKIFTALFPPSRRAAVGLAIISYEWIGQRFDFKVEVPTSKVRGAVSELPADGFRNWEAASFGSAAASGALSGTCEVVWGNCPLYAVGAIDFGSAACIILGGQHMDVSKVCTSVPQCYRQAGTFVIDLRSLLSDQELRRDNNGAWGKPAGHSRYYKIDPLNGDAVRVDRGHKLIEGSDYDIQILSKRYEHTAVGGRFVRKIYTGRSPSADRYYQSSSHFAVITYYWKGEPEWFEATPQKQVRATHESREMSSRSALYNNLINFQDQQVEEQLEDDGEPETPGPSCPAPSIPPVEPPRKRTRTTTMPNYAQTNKEMEALRAMVYKKEFENQERFSNILDRAEAFLERLERATEAGFAEQVWVQSTQSDHQVVTREQDSNGIIIAQSSQEGEFPTEYILHQE